MLFEKREYTALQSPQSMGFQLSMIHPSVCLSVYLLIHLSIHPSVYLLLYTSISLSNSPNICFSFSIHPSIHPSVYLLLSTSLSLSNSLNICFSLSTHPSVYPSIHPSIHLSIYHLSSNHNYILFLSISQDTVHYNAFICIFLDS